MIIAIQTNNERSCLRVIAIIPTIPAAGPNTIIDIP
jgi:hypothetical protein